MKLFPSPGEGGETAKLRKKKVWPGSPSRTGAPEGARVALQGAGQDAREPATDGNKTGGQLLELGSPETHHKGVGAGRGWAQNKKQRKAQGPLAQEAWPKLRRRGWSVQDSALQTQE